MNSSQTPKKVYDAFRESMLADTDDWKDLVGENPTIVGPLVRTEGRENFIRIHEAWFESVEKNVVHAIVEQGDLVITQIATTFESVNKQSLTLDLCEWYTIKNGKIEGLVVYFDASVLKSADANRYSMYK